MQIDPVFVSGAWWIDTDQAAELLRVSPATLQRHRQTVKFASLDSIVWHHVLLFRLDDVVCLSANTVSYTHLRAHET